MRTIPGRVLAALLPLAVMGKAVSAEETAPPKAERGMGLAVAPFVGCTIGQCASIAVHRWKGPRVIQARWLSAVQPLAVNDGEGLSTTDELALLGGIHARAARAAFLTTIGLAAVRTDRSVPSGRFSCEPRDTVCYPISQTVTRWKPGLVGETRATFVHRKVGVGLAVSLGLNKHATYFGMGLTAEVGRLR